MAEELARLGTTLATALTYIGAGNHDGIDQVVHLNDSLDLKSGYVAAHPLPEKAREATTSRQRRP